MPLAGADAAFVQDGRGLGAGAIAGLREAAYDSGDEQASMLRQAGPHQAGPHQAGPSQADDAFPVDSGIDPRADDGGSVRQGPQRPRVPKKAKRAFSERRSSRACLRGVSPRGLVMDAGAGSRRPWLSHPGSRLFWACVGQGESIRRHHDRAHPLRRRPLGGRLEPRPLKTRFGASAGAAEGESALIFCRSALSLKSPHAQRGRNPMPETATWIATFNGAEARFYEWRRADKTLTPLDLGVEAGAHRPDYADRPVRSYASAGSARGSGDEQVDGERSLEQAYVTRVAEALERSLGRFDRLVVAAAPRALGAFRSAAAGSVLDKLWREIRHDYVNTPADSLVERLTAHGL